MAKAVKMLPLAPPPSLKQVPPSSLIASPETPSKNTSSSKRRARLAVSRAILNSIKQTRRKLESDYTIKEEPATTLTIKDAEEKAETICQSSLTERREFQLILKLALLEQQSVIILLLCTCFEMSFAPVFIAAKQ